MAPATKAKKAPAPKRKAKEVKRLYWSISEVGELTGVQPHVLRYWETEFPTLKPKKNRSGNRPPLRTCFRSHEMYRLKSRGHLATRARIFGISRGRIISRGWTSLGWRKNRTRLTSRPSPVRTVTTSVNRP